MAVAFSFAVVGLDGDAVGGWLVLLVVAAAGVVAAAVAVVVVAVVGESFMLSFSLSEQNKNETLVWSVYLKEHAKKLLFSIGILFISARIRVHRLSKDTRERETK